MNDIEQTKKALLEKYSQQLDELFASETFNLSFDERERLITGKLDESALVILEEHLQRDPESTEQNTSPAPSALCYCGAESNLILDENGCPKKHRREIKAKTGPVMVEEYGYLCSCCRRIFFPCPKETSAI